MELRHLRYFCAVAECKGFSHAAQRLHVAQSAISDQMRDLELEIGVRLIDRGQRQIALTSHGEIFLKEAKEVLAHAARAVELAQRSQRGEVGTLSIGFMAFATAGFLPRLIRDYRRLYPEVSVSLHEMVSSKQVEAFAERKIDVGFMRALEPVLTRSLASELLYNDPIVAVLPKGHPLAPGPIPVAALSQENFVMYARESNAPLFDTIIGLCKDAGFSPHVVNTPDLAQTLLTLVEAGEGIALVPSGVRHLRPRGLVFCRLRPDTARVGLVMAWRPEPESAVQKALLDLVRERKARIQSAMVGRF
jgi:DNA-binding transcriptional LysR family regulator